MFDLIRRIIMKYLHLHMSGMEKQSVQSSRSKSTETPPRYTPATQANITQNLQQNQNLHTTTNVNVNVNTIDNDKYVCY